jgi:hypothetical protein
MNENKTYEYISEIRSTVVRIRDILSRVQKDLPNSTDSPYKSSHVTKPTRNLSGKTHKSVD